MAILTERQRPIDAAALEARTQAIGRELFAAVRAAHAHLSVLNRWTAQVLNWCLADPALKSSVLRFLDVLPSLAGAPAIARHVREYFPSANSRLPSALRLGATLARPGLLTAGAVAGIVQQLVRQVAQQFIAESHAEAVPRLVDTMAQQGLTCSIDLLGEQILSEAEADRYGAQCQALLAAVAQADAALRLGSPPANLAQGKSRAESRDAALGARAPRSCGPRVNLSVKPSALTPRFDPISPASSLERALRRLAPILRVADEHQALVNLDMEQYELRDLTLNLARHLLSQAGGLGRARLGLVVQAYLRDAEPVTEELLGWVSAQHQALTVRLVKGAYWDHEMALAAQLRRPAPVFAHKTQTDRAFEQLTVRLLTAHPLVTTAIASHNVRSIAHAMAVAEALGLEKSQLEFQVLYGMGEALAGAIVERGYPVRVYTPIGELIPGMAYLVRRLLENTANESFLRQDFFGERSADALLTPPQPPADDGESHPVNEWRGEPFTDFARPAAQEQMQAALGAVRRQFGAEYASQLADGSRESGEPLLIRNPADPTQVLGRVILAQPAQANHAVRLAEAEQPRWARTPLEERVRLLRRAAELMRQRRVELAAWEVLEVGKTWREADADVVEAIDYMEYYSREMVRLAAGRPLIQAPGEHNRSVYRPRGVAVVIAPWNFPAAILTGMASAALVSGHVVILKPAEQSSLIAAQVARIFREAGLPAGAVQYVPGWGQEVGAALVRHPGTRLILFTGSKAVGLSIVRACAAVGEGQRFVKHVVAEMGGKNALVIDADADLDAAVQGTLVSAFGYGGQKCSAASRLIVHEAVAKRFLERLCAATDRLIVGDPADPATDLGPLIEEAAQQRLEQAMAQAEEVGRLLYRAPASRLPRRGFFVGPAIATDIPPQHPLAREELFGPLVCVFRVRTFAEALALANDSEYALTGGLYSRSPAHIEQAAQEFDVGNLYINRPITGAIVGRQPFGGHRLSGLGTQAGGSDYLLQLLLPQTVCVNTARHGMPLE